MSLYLAFASGSITYDCRPCGRCCRGLGIADDIVHLRGSKDIRSLGPWVDGTAPAGGLVSFFTYADGCRYLGAENLCGLHAKDGAAAKPRICRLFPFSKLVDVDGLWVVLPHEACPWTARGTAPAPLSEHASILADLGPEILAQLQPAARRVLTPVPPSTRAQLEVAIRDHIVIDAPVADALALVRRAHATSLDREPAQPDASLWLDLLRCAGEPPALAAAHARLFLAALPALRLELVDLVTIDRIPAALEALELWLRALLAELGDRPLGGDDLLALARRARPLLRVLARVDEPVPTLSPTDGALSDLVAALQNRIGEPLGEALLVELRHFDRGAVSLLGQVGELLAP